MPSVGFEPTVLAFEQTNEDSSRLRRRSHVIGTLEMQAVIPTM
jgi:hypothetical protein